MAEQLGLRKIIEDRFHTLWGVPGSAAPQVVRLPNSADRAGRRWTQTSRSICRCGAAVPAEFEDLHPWVFSKLGRGGGSCTSGSPAGVR
jgi:hypothetical protein